MAQILLIDDLPPERRRISDYLGGNGHQVVSIDGSNMETLFSEARDWFDANKEIVDVLVLDIAYNNLTLGGIYLYLQLEEAGYNHRWKHLIIYTLLYSQAVEEDFEKLVDFFISKGVPAENLVSKEPVTMDNLLKRINELTNP